MKNLAQRRDALLKKFKQYSEFARGSINSVCAKCNRARCVCDKKTAQRVYRLTYKNSQQKTRIVYVPRHRLPKIRKMIANYARSRRIIEQLIETNLEIFKKQAGR
jgi:hypothetical protein